MKKRVYRIFYKIGDYETRMLGFHKFNPEQIFIGSIIKVDHAMYEIYEINDDKINVK